MSNHQENWHSRVLEQKLGLFTGLTVVAILIGGLVEIVPMYTVAANAPTNAHLVAPYTPLELAGRDIYVREGCYNCHSQMIRPMRSETMRYGEWSRAAEYVHDRPFQLGSRRIGPDLQRVGGKYPDAWHYEHMRDPRATTPDSIMPPYQWLYRRTIDPTDVAATMRAMAIVGEDYSDAQIASVAETLAAQAAGIVQRLADANITDADPNSEIVALIAYLQRLGTDGDAVINGVAAPTEAAPTEAAPTEAAPTEAAPTEAAPTEAAPTEAAPTEAAPTEAAPTEAAPTEAAPTEAAPTEAAPTEAAPTEAAPTEAAPRSPTEATE